MRISRYLPEHREAIFPWIFSAVLIVWISFSIFRTGYNVAKLFTQDSHLFFLNDRQKTREVYGDIESMRQSLALITKGEPFLLVTNDGEIYFFLRYLLYPQKVYWTHNVTREDEYLHPWKYVFYPYMTPGVNEKHAVQIIDRTTDKNLGIIKQK